MHANFPTQDINGKRIHVYEASRGGHRTIQLEQPIGCIVPTSNPDVLLAALEVSFLCTALSNLKGPRGR